MFKKKEITFFWKILIWIQSQRPCHHFSMNNQHWESSYLTKYSWFHVTGLKSTKKTYFSATERFNE